MTTVRILPAQADFLTATQHTATDHDNLTIDHDGLENITAAQHHAVNHADAQHTDGPNAKTADANTWAQKQTFSGEIEVDGALNHDGAAVGFFGVTPIAQRPAFTQTETTTARAHTLGPASEAHAFSVVYSDTEVEAACNALGARINEVKALVNALIDDSQAIGIAQ